MTIELLYHHDSLLLDFRAAVVGHATWNGSPSVVLDRTAFYPEAGGQMADRGVLAGAPVRDVQIDDAGTVHHLVDGPLPEVGAEVAGAIDRDRRRAHMALHTGQHMLSRALVDVMKGDTISSRLGESSCTIEPSVGSNAKETTVPFSSFSTKTPLPSGSNATCRGPAPFSISTGRGSGPSRPRSAS